MVNIRQSTKGMQIGQKTADKIALYGVTPIAQRAGAAQAVIGAATYAAPGAVPANSVQVTAPTTAEFNAALAALASTRTQLIALAADVDAHKTLINELRAAQVAFGAIKGGA